MLDYAQTAGIVFDGPVYSLYLLDGISMTDSSRYLVQVVVGVKKG
jgi:effector-binding domain-containing protein